MKCLITEQFHENLQIKLSNAGIECLVLEDIDTGGVLDIIDGFDIIVVNSKMRMDRKMLDRAKKLKIIGRVGSGLEIIDLNICLERQIAVFSAPEGNCTAVGEHCLALLLNLLHHISKANDEINRGIWQREANRGIELTGKTVGIIGYGHTGNAFAQMLHGFQVGILAHDKYKSNFGNDRVVESSLEEIYAQADIVSLHLPLTQETNFFADRTFFEKFAKPIFLINTSRGSVCDTAALLNAIEVGKVYGAGLDVFENENGSLRSAEDHQLWEQIIASPKILKTPHIAGWTSESKLKLAEITANKIISELKRIRKDVNYSD
ncbi:MAG: hypothetical protein IPK03_11900 [Bacteroidetes bacterium]|nr:hypothetical protein [Bacteroidota bacterium]